MKIRLIKPGAPRVKQEKVEKPSDEVQIVDTIRSWVRDFKSRKTRIARSDLLLLRKARKT